MDKIESGDVSQPLSTVTALFTQWAPEYNDRAGDYHGLKMGLPHQA